MAIDELVNRAWAAWERARTLHPEIVPETSTPILWFGDRTAYDRSRTKVVTVGVNPGPQAFPASEPWAGYPRLRSQPRDVATFVLAMNEFPLVDWFEDWNPLLNELQAPHPIGVQAGAHRPLHVDLVPLMTDPTWSRVEQRAPLAAEAMMKDGLDLLARLLAELKPDITLVSLKTQQFNHMLATLRGTKRTARSLKGHHVVEFTAPGAGHGVWVQKTGQEPLSRLSYGERSALGRWIAGGPFPDSGDHAAARLEAGELVDLLRLALSDTTSQRWMDLRGRRVWRSTVRAKAPDGQAVHLSSQATPAAIREFVERWDRDPRCRSGWGRQTAKSVDHVTFPPDHGTIAGLYLRWETAG